MEGERELRREGIGAVRAGGARGFILGARGVLGRVNDWW
jgi:hypothetical protein